MIPQYFRLLTNYFFSRSSYPAETQFRPATEFTDDELRNGRIQQLEDATGNLSLDSPANNTRRRSMVRMSISSRRSPPKPVKKKQTPPKPVSIIISPPKKAKKDAINTVGIPKTQKSPFVLETPPQTTGLRPRKRPSMTSKIDLENSDVIKKPRKETMSYSKPGPPTPARRSNRSFNNSLNKSTASNVSIITTGSNASNVRPKSKK